MVETSLVIKPASGGTRPDFLSVDLLEMLMEIEETIEVLRIPSS